MSNESDGLMRRYDGSLFIFIGPETIIYQNRSFNKIRNPGVCDILKDQSVFLLPMAGSSL